MEFVVWICPLKKRAVKKDIMVKEGKYTLYICPEESNCGTDYVLYMEKEEETAINCISCDDKSHFHISWKQIAIKNDDYLAPIPVLQVEAEFPLDCRLQKIELTFEITQSSFVYELYKIDGKMDVKDNNFLPLKWLNFVAQAVFFWIVNPDGSCDGYNFDRPQLIAINRVARAYFYVNLRKKQLLPGSSIKLKGIFNEKRNKETTKTIATCWYETPCWTSAVVLGAGLVESIELSAPAKEIPVLEGGYGQALKDEWVGDERLAYLVKLRESLYWIRPSDFTRYEIGERVYVVKLIGDNLPLSRKGLFCRKQQGSIFSKDNIFDDTGMHYLIVPQVFE